MFEVLHCGGSQLPVSCQAVTSVGQIGGAEEENRDTEHGVEEGGRKIATHNAPPGRPCCCWRRKGVRAGAVSLVTES